MEKLRALFNQLTTGRDNVTPAIGRYMGGVAFAGLVLAMTIITLSFAWAVWKTGDPRMWDVYLDKVPNYFLLIAGGIAALIGGTAFTEPAPPSFKHTTVTETTVQPEGSN